MVNHPDIAWCEALQLRPPDRERLGGKAAGLVRLMRHGVDVPPFFVLSAGDDPQAVEAAVELWRDTCWERVAVRSSATAEDGVSHSFAGMFQSVLGVTDEAGLRWAIATCRASGRADRVRAYRAQHGLPDTPVHVIVQLMVEGTASGVLFSTDPLEPDRALVSATWGLGEGVVQGAVPTDTFRVDASGGIAATLAHKDVAVRLVDGAPTEVPVPPQDRDLPCLTDAQLRSLVGMGRRLQGQLGGPQDIEFTIDDDGEVVLLQVRPITQPIPRGRRLLWDNSNIIESYYGPVSPLTYTFARDAYSIVYQLFCEVMGVSRQTIRENASVFPRMIGLVRGRISYNLNAWYRVVSLLPGYRFNRRFLEQMMGVSEVAADADASFDTDGGGRLADLGRLLRLGVRLGWRAWRLDADVARFHRDFDAALSRHRQRDLSQEAPHVLLDGYHQLESELLWAWSTPIVNDFFVMIGFGVLRSLCQRWVPDEPDLHNALMAGQGGLDSTAPTRDARKLAARIRENKEATALFVGDGDSAGVMDGLERWPDLRQAYDDWIEAWGDRCSDELKLEVPSMRQRPEELVTVLRGYLRGAPPTLAAPEHGGPDDAGMAAQAQAKVDAAVRGPRRWLLGRVIRFARHRVKSRENLRFLRTRVFGRVREIFTALGQHMVRAHTIDALEDVWWLTVEEVFGWVRGTTPTSDFRGLVALRRAEYAAFEAQPAPADRFHTWGPVWAHNRFLGKPAAVAPPGGDGLRGLAACPGVVEGPVRVVTDARAEEPLSGEILVAYRTDPGWVPLFPGALAILVERGSLLSHSAVVARELGIPSVVAIAGLMNTLRTGDQVRVDAAAGTVQILERAT